LRVHVAVADRGHDREREIWTDPRQRFLFGRVPSGSARAAQSYAYVSSAADEMYLCRLRQSMAVTSQASCVQAPVQTRARCCSALDCATASAAANTRRAGVQMLESRSSNCLHARNPSPSREAQARAMGHPSRLGALEGKERLRRWACELQQVGGMEAVLSSATPGIPALFPGHLEHRGHVIVQRLPLATERWPTRGSHVDKMQRR
jgi:hypothetical protein